MDIKTRLFRAIDSFLLVFGLCSLPDNYDERGFFFDLREKEGEELKLWILGFECGGLNMSFSDMFLKIYL
jgi:hypothetical protein